jgi:hypothetical protein
MEYIKDKPSAGSFMQSFTCYFVFVLLPRRNKTKKTALAREDQCLLIKYPP